MASSANRIAKSNGSSKNGKQLCRDLSGRSSVSAELVALAGSLEKHFETINKSLLDFKDNVLKIEAENSALVPVSSVSKKKFNAELADADSTLQDGYEDYSYQQISPSTLFSPSYFQADKEDHYSFHLINFFIKVLKLNMGNTNKIDLFNYQDFKNALLNQKIQLVAQYNVFYFVEKDEGGKSDAQYHYLCLVDKSNFDIHLINPLNNYSIFNDTIKLKEFLDQEFKTNKFKIRIAHVPISKKNYNSGPHTLLNIYSLVSDVNKFINNYNLKGNDQFDFFVPDNEMIRQQNYTVLSYILQNIVLNPAMGAFVKYNDYLRRLKV